MRKTSVLISFSLIILIGVLVGVVSAAQEVNYTVNTESTSSVIQVTQLKYDPYPVNPGEYFDLWVKAQWTGTGARPTDATFNLVPEYPFSLDSNENATRSFGAITNEPVVFHYKVRVDKDAVEGVNELKLQYNTDGYNAFWNVQTFDIQVQDAQTDFDLVIQESSGSNVAIAVANIGKNTANSLIVRIPQQDGFRVSGTNGQMVGNLNSGDYSIVSFGLTPVSRNAAALQVQLDYTDNIGVRRSVVKDVQFVSGSPVGNATGGYGNFSRGSFQRASASTQSQSSSIWKNVWFWIVIVIVLVAGYYVYRNPDEAKNILSKFKKNKSGSEKSSRGTPEWVSTERTKKK